MLSRVTVTSRDGRTQVLDAIVRMRTGGTSDLLFTWMDNNTGQTFTFIHPVRLEVEDWIDEDDAA